MSNIPSDIVCKRSQAPVIEAWLGSRQLYVICPYCHGGHVHGHGNKAVALQWAIGLKHGEVFDAGSRRSHCIDAIGGDYSLRLVGLLTPPRHRLWQLAQANISLRWRRSRSRRATHRRAA